MSKEYLIAVSKAPANPQEKAEWSDGIIRIQVAMWVDDGFRCYECGLQPASVDKFLAIQWYRTYLPWTPETAMVCESCWLAHKEKHRVEYKGKE